jgi:hypothetical protein
MWGENDPSGIHLHLREMTLHFTVAESIAPSVAALHGAANHDSNGNRGRERKSLRLKGNRLEKPPEFVLHLLSCAARDETAGKRSAASSRRTCEANG